MVDSQLLQQSPSTLSLSLPSRGCQKKCWIPGKKPTWRNAYTLTARLFLKLAAVTIIHRSKGGVPMLPWACQRQTSHAQPCGRVYSQSQTRARWGLPLPEVSTHLHRMKHATHFLSFLYIYQSIYTINISCTVSYKTNISGNINITVACKTSKVSLWISRWESDHHWLWMNWSSGD